MKNKLGLLADIFVLSTVLLCSCNDANDVVIRDNYAPKYTYNEYVNIINVANIDITQISLFNKSNNYENLISFDDKQRMFVLDSFDRKMYVFNSNGNIVQEFGKPGQGPGDFDNPNAILIRGKQLYIFQGHYECKVLTLNGEYVNNKRLFIENRLSVKNVNDNFYILHAHTDTSFTKLELIISVFKDDFTDPKEIFRYKYPPGLSGPNYDFRWRQWLLISDNGTFYFPSDNLSSYTITHYDKHGKAVLVFSRPYSLTKYSQAAKARFEKLYEKEIKRGDVKFPVYPPVIVNMFQDIVGNIWVISGETYEDNMDPNYENQIDIFSTDGAWLCSFKSSEISRYCLYNNGRIYRVFLLDKDQYKQYMKVYEIQYLRK